MSQATKLRLTHALFRVSVFAKGVDGAFEVLGGAILLLITPARIETVVRLLTQHELSEDPHDFIARYLLNGANHLTSGTRIFAAIYLLWHGAIKVGLVAGLLLRRRSAYPAAIVAFSVFVVYQIYRYSHTRSVALIVLSVIDLIVIVLTWAEYKRLAAMREFAGRSAR